MGACQPWWTGGSLTWRIEGGGLSLAAGEQWRISLWHRRMCVQEAA